jgi:hypothetical protein
MEKNIEYTKSLYDFVKITKNEGVENLNNYKSFVDERQFVYPNLHKFLLEKGELK